MTQDNENLHHSVKQVKDLFNYPNLIRCQSTDDDRSAVNQKWNNSKLRLIDNFFNDMNIKDYLDIVLIDTAPLHLNANGSKFLAEESKIWVSDSILTKQNESKEKRYLEAWISILISNQKSGVAPFQHPSFTGAIPIDEWS